jgi:hypothetical protein
MKRQVKGKDVIKDLRSGMADWELQVKYRLSPRELRTVFRNLVDRNAITHTELYENSSFYREATDGFKERKHCRADLPVYVPVTDLGTLAVGVLRDISETGFRVAGMEASVGQIKTVEIPVNMFIPAEPLLISAKCKWVETKGRHRVYTVAGFEITDASEKVGAILREFTDFISLSSKTGEWPDMP